MINIQFKKVFILFVIAGLISTTLYAAEDQVVKGKLNGSYGSLYEVTFPEGNAKDKANTALFRFNVNGTNYGAYCIDLYKSWANNQWHEMDGDAGPKIAWILHNYYPATSAPSGGIFNDNKYKVAAVQVAIWHFSDGIDVSDPSKYRGDANNKAVMAKAKAIIESAGNLYIGSVPKILTLLPDTDVNPQGTNHTVTATIKNQNGNPINNYDITFTVTGANSASGTVKTNSSGQAQFTYSGTNVGTDQITAKTGTFTVKKGIRYRPVNEPNRQKIVIAEKFTDELCVQVEKTWEKGNPSLDILTEFDVSCAKMEYTTTGWVKNTGDAGGDIAVDVRFWWEVKDPADAKYIDDITFSGDFTNLVGQEQREVGLTITMTNDWKTTSHNTEVKVWIYAEPTNRPGHVAKNTLTITSHWGQKIIIEKQTVPDGSTQLFNFDGAIDTNLKDNQSSSKFVSTGTHKVSEVVPSGWTLTNITVDDANSTFDLSKGEVTFHVETNETVKAVFTNTHQPSKIIIEKQTIPDGDSQTFDYTGEITTTLGDGQSKDKTVTPGTYVVTESVQSGWTLSDLTVDDSNSIVDKVNRTVTFKVEAGETVKAVFTNTRKPAALGDKVWYDDNRDGIQDAGESGVNNVTVKLYDSGDNLLKSTTSNSSGIYHFTDLEPGDYYVGFSNLPADYEFSDKDQGSDDAKDSDADKTTGKTATVTLAAGETNNTLDAGIRIKLGSIGDFVWNDVNMDGLQNNQESGVGNITVTLYKKSDNSIFKTMTTNANGVYLFENIPAGTYYIIFSNIPSGFKFTQANSGPNDGIDSDADESTGKTPDITLLAGEINRTLDAGIFELASFGNYVWLDINKNGKQDSNEEGINDIEVSLYKDADNDGNSEPNGDDGPAIKTTTTKTYLGKKGYYKFTDLIPGNYFIVFQLPTDYEFTDKDASSNDKDSDADKSTGVTDVTTLSPGENDDTWDAGVYSTLGSLGDYVWYDSNQNGVQEKGEPGIGNVVVKLYNKKGIKIKTETTNSLGKYLFSDLKASNYTIEFVLPSQQYSFTLLHQGTGTTNSDADRTTGKTGVITLNEGENDMSWDAGMYLMLPLGGGKRIIARYQPWYGDVENDSTLRYWDKDYFGGHADTSLFDFYDSYDADMHEYQILHAWACGIDGFAVDWFGRNSYENPGMKGLLDKADSLYKKFSNRGFNFEIAASYNELAIDRLDTNFVYLGDVLMNHPAYWGKRRGVRRPVFIYNEVENTIITPQEYRTCGDTTLPSDYFLLWNNTENEAFEPMDVCYPWVQCLNDNWDDILGLNWGDIYLDTTYFRMNYVAKPGDLLFALGAVWPGLNDKDWSKGENHWMSRQDTLVYEETWEKVHEYSFNYSLPMKWVMVETWNDYNRSTEIEPSLEHDYKFNVLTRDHARRFKSTIPPDSVGVENPGLLVPQHILQARRAAELRPTETSTINNLIDQALDKFFDRKYYEALSIADKAAGIAPKPFTIDSVSETSVSIHWSRAEHADAYIICYSTDASVFEPCAFKRPDVVLVGDITSYTLTDLNSNSKYYIAVVAANTDLNLYANFSWYENTITGAKVKSFSTSIQKTGIEQNENNIPKEFALKQNYPNPFNPSTTIKYDLPKAQHVVIMIYDIQGRQVRKIVDEFKQAGWHSVEFYADNLSSGVYFYRIQTEEFTRLHKMLLLK